MPTAAPSTSQTGFRMTVLDGDLLFFSFAYLADVEAAHQLCAASGALAAPEPAGTPEPTAEARNPRKARPARRTSSDPQSIFSGLRGCPLSAGAGFPAFSKTGYSDTAVSMADSPTTPAVVFVAKSRAAPAVL